MSPGPLRRLTGAVGLAALAPTAWLLATGSLTMIDAALRAAATLMVVLIVGRVAAVVVTSLARFMERTSEDVSGS